jgi:hypothetical protein
VTDTAPGGQTLTTLCAESCEITVKVSDAGSRSAEILVHVVPLEANQIIPLQLKTVSLSFFRITIFFRSFPLNLSIK